jgi:protein phosphatase
MSVTLNFTIVGVTDTGQIRKDNEDCIGWDVERNLLVLADGMGGHTAGDVASSMAVDGILRGYQLPCSNSNDEVRILTQLLEDINADIYHRAQDMPDCERMGTTLAMVCLYNQHVTVLHAGDSRVYRFRAGVLDKLTEDHSLVTQLIEQGTMTKDEAENSRYRNVITRALGVRPHCDIEINQYPAEPEDVYLLCSDGLSNLVSDDLITKILTDHGQNLQCTAQIMVDLANQAGGDDNISVVLAVISPAE